MGVWRVVGGVRVGGRESGGWSKGWGWGEWCVE